MPYREVKQVGCLWNMCGLRMPCLFKWITTNFATTFLCFLGRPLSLIIHLPLSSLNSSLSLLTSLTPRRASDWLVHPVVTQQGEKWGAAAGGYGALRLAEAAQSSRYRSFVKVNRADREQQQQQQRQRRRVPHPFCSSLADDCAQVARAENSRKQQEGWGDADRFKVVFFFSQKKKRSGSVETSHTAVSVEFRATSFSSPSFCLSQCSRGVQSPQVISNVGTAWPTLELNNSTKFELDVPEGQVHSCKEKVS